MLNQEKKIEYNINRKNKRHLLGISKRYNTGLSVLDRAAYFRKYRKEKKLAGTFNRGDRVAQGKRWRIKNPIKKKAQRKLNYAVEKGLLVRPHKCSICLSNGKTQAHHDNYNKPLEVIWVCQNCHNEIHKNGGKLHGKQR